MSSRQLRSRSQSVDSRAGSAQSNIMDDNSLTGYSQGSGITAGGNLDNEVIAPNPSLGNTSGVGPVIDVISDEQSSNISRGQLQEFLVTVMQAIRAESAKQTAALQEE